MKKVGKTTRLFRYDLSQIPYDYTVEVTNRFKGLDLIDTMPEEYGRRFVTLYRRHKLLMYCAGDQNYPPKKEMQKGKMIV